MIATGRKAHLKFTATGKSTVVPAASNTDPTAIMQNVPYYTEPDRGLIPEYDNKFNLASWEPWLTFDGIQLADKLTKPTLLVHSEAAAIPDGARQFADRMGAKATMFWLDNVTQFDFYDNPDPINQTLDQVVDHFTSELNR